MDETLISITPNSLLRCFFGPLLFTLGGLAIGGGIPAVILKASGRGGGGGSRVDSGGAEFVIMGAGIGATVGVIASIYTLGWGALAMPGIIIAGWAIALKLC